MTKGNRRFHRLSTKFICGTAAILALILAATLFVNSKVAARYYLRQPGRQPHQGIFRRWNVTGRSRRQPGKL